MPKLAQLVYDFLNVAEAPREADCIFVLAGKPERKAYAVDLWRLGYAPELILSVGRFEWRGFYSLGLESDGGLHSCVRQTPPARRHFFVHVSHEGATCSPIECGRLGTMTEVRALATQLHGAAKRSLLVVSSGVHLRRVALTLRRAFRGRGIEFCFVAVPDEISYLKRADLRISACARAEVWKELEKYLFYCLLRPITSNR